MRRALVIGAGLSGLTTALYAARELEPNELLVVERAPRVGGQIWTDRSGELLVERGGEGFVFRSEAVPALAAEVGVADQLIGQAVFTSYGFGERGLAALAPGEAATFLGFQVPRGELGRGIRTLRSGMGSLVEAAARTLERRGVPVRTAVAVDGIAQTHGGLRVRCADGSAIDVRQVVVATNAASAARMLADLLPDAASVLHALEHAATVSSVTVELAFDRAAIGHPLDGTGFVVAADLQEQGLRACTFTTSKFEGRAPRERVLLRAFFRPEPADLARSDEAWTARALAGLARVLPMRGAPLQSWVSRWPDALPVHSPEHAAIVAQLEAALHPLGVCLAGAAFHGSGIDAAVRSGENAARFLAGALATPQAAPQ